MIISQLFKKEICKEVLKNSGQENNKKTVDAIFLAVNNDRFLFELQNNKIVIFVTWSIPQNINGRNIVFIENLWIDPEYRKRKYLVSIRTIFRRMFPNTIGIWFNRKKQKMIERS